VVVPVSARADMFIRVYVDGPDSLGDWHAWVLDLIGCVAVAPSENESLAKVPQAIARYCEFVHRHSGRDDACDSGAGEPVVAERLVGVDEGLFDADREAASLEQIERTIDLLLWTRADLLAVLASVPEAAFDWDPPYRRYASWAQWRTIGEILAHIAICETRYYLRGIGYAPGPNPATPGNPTPGSRAWYTALGRDWRTLLARTREETVAFLGEVARSSNHRRVHEEPGYCWSVRKVLRRLVWHELAHTRNISRILCDFSRQAM